jgi:hypothetical protein
MNCRMSVMKAPIAALACANVVPACGEVREREPCKGFNSKQSNISFIITSAAAHASRTR